MALAVFLSKTEKLFLSLSQPPVFEENGTFLDSFLDSEANGIEHEISVNTVFCQSVTHTKAHPSNMFTLHILSDFYIKNQILKL